MSPTRVLHIIWSLDSRDGGPPAALLGLLLAQQKQGLTVSVCASFREGAEGKIAAQLREAGVEVRLIGPCRGPLLGHPSMKARVADAVKNADVVHIHGLWEEINHRAARSAQTQGTPYLVRPCGMLDPWSLSQGRLKKQVYLAWRLRRNLNGAAALHFTSDLERDGASPLQLRPSVLVEPNGVDLDEFSAPSRPNSFRARFGLSAEQPLALFMGRLHVKKGLDLLIPAFARLDSKDAVLVIAGPDADGYRAHVEADVAAHGLEKRVIFAGMLQGADRVAAFRDADIFVLPSYQENFGIVVVEALAAGTPVIVSDAVNIHRQISAAGVGSVVPLEVEALSQELMRWLQDPALRAKASHHAREFVQRNFDWNTIAQRWAQHYAELPKSGRSG